MDKFRPARLDEYIDWLAAFFDDGFLPTYSYDYPWARARMLTATDHFRLGGERGSAARPIIIPKGIGWTGDIGHNTLFQWQWMTTIVPSTVPVYDDAEFDRFPQVEMLRIHARTEKARWDADLAARDQERRRLEDRSDLSRYTRAAKSRSDG